MADIRSLKVVGDLGSESERRLRKSYNALLDLLGAMLDELAVAGAIGAVNTAATNALALLETDSTNVLKVLEGPEVPNRPHFPVS